MAAAVLWEKADREGWDNEHYDPLIREQHDRNAESWAAKKGLFTNRRGAA